MSKPSFILFEDIVEVLRVDDKQFAKGENTVFLFLLSLWSPHFTERRSEADSSLKRRAEMCLRDPRISRSS